MCLGGENLFFVVDRFAARFVQLDLCIDLAYTGEDFGIIARSVE